MSPEDFRAVEVQLASTHAGMATLLGISEVSVKRYANGLQPVPEHVARLAVALLLIDAGGQHQRFGRLLAKYHRTAYRTAGPEDDLPGAARERGAHCP